MNHRKFQPMRAISKLLKSGGSCTFEQNLKTQLKAEAYYTITSMPRV